MDFIIIIIKIIFSLLRFIFMQQLRAHDVAIELLTLYRVIHLYHSLASRPNSSHLPFPRSNYCYSKGCTTFSNPNALPTSTSVVLRFLLCWAVQNSQGFPRCPSSPFLIVFYCSLYFSGFPPFF